MSANPPTAATVSKVYDKLRSMGVTSHGVAVKQALLSSRGNVDSAVALLFNRGQVRPPGSQSTATTTTKPKLQASLSQAASTTSAASAPAAADADVSMGGPSSAASAVVTTTTKVQYTENPMFAASKQPRKANSGAGAGAGAGSGASTVASTSGDATAGQGRRPSVATPTSTAKLFESIRVKALQGIIQSRLRVNPVTGDNVASWRGVLFRHLKIQGNDRLAEAASKIHKCLHDDTLLSGSRATWLSVIARYFAVVASLDVAKTRNPLATLPAPAGNPPKTESEDSASTKRKRSRSDDGDASSGRASRARHSEDTDTSRSARTTAESPKEAKPQGARSVDEAIAQARLRAGQLKNLLQRSTNLYLAHKNSVAYLVGQRAKVAALVSKQQARVRELETEVTKQGLSISLVDKRLHTELSSHGEVPSTSQEILTLALDLVMSGNTAVQEIIQVRKSMLSVQTSTRKCIDGVKAEIALLKAVDTLCVGLKEVLDAKREQLATEMRERRAAMMKLTTQCLSNLLYAARAGADYELTRTERASADVRELSASIATHDELYGTLAPTRRAGLAAQRREMRAVVEHSKRLQHRMVLKLRNFARTCLPTYPPDVRKPLRKYLVDVLGKGMTGREADVLALLKPALAELVDFASPTAACAQPLPVPPLQRPGDATPRPPAVPPPPMPPPVPPRRPAVFGAVRSPPAAPPRPTPPPPPPPPSSPSSAPILAASPAVSAAPPSASSASSAPSTLAAATTTTITTHRSGTAASSAPTVVAAPVSAPTSTPASVAVAPSAGNPAPVVNVIVPPAAAPPPVARPPANPAASARGEDVNMASSLSTVSEEVRSEDAKAWAQLAQARHVAPVPRTPGAVGVPGGVASSQQPTQTPRSGDANSSCVVM